MTTNEEQYKEDAVKLIKLNKLNSWEKDFVNNIY
jgi:hypothetical protein